MSTPRGQSWDEEQIAKYGLFAHLDMVSAPFRAENRRRRQEQVQLYIEDVLALLSDSSEDGRARASVAIPDVITALSLGELAMPNWRQAIADQVYSDWCRRTGELDAVSFYSLPAETQKPFLDIIEAVIQVHTSRGGQ